MEAKIIARKCSSLWSQGKPEKVLVVQEFFSLNFEWPCLCIKAHEIVIPDIIIYSEAEMFG